MNFNNYPRDYESIFAPTEVSIYGCDPAQPADVELIECYRNDTLGVRRLCGRERYNFSPTGYLRHTIAYAPMIPYQSPWILATVLRTLKLKVRLGLFESPAALLTAARTRIEPDTLLSAMPSPKRLPRNGFDELSVVVGDTHTYAIFRFFGPGGIEARVDSPTTRVAHEMAVLHFGLNGMCPALERQGFEIGQFDRLEVTFYANDRPCFVQKYLLEEPDPEAAAIGWVNGQGGLDVYTLFHECKRTMSLKRTLGRDPIDDHALHGLQADTLIDLVSDHEPQATIDWLAGMLTAPNVWLLTEDRAQEVVVTNSQVDIRGERPARLSLSCKPIASPHFQNIG